MLILETDPDSYDGQDQNESKFFWSPQLCCALKVLLYKESEGNQFWSLSVGKTAHLVPRDLVNKFKHSSFWENIVWTENVVIKYTLLIQKNSAMSDGVRMSCYNISVWTMGNKCFLTGRKPFSLTPFVSLSPTGLHPLQLILLTIYCN